MRSLHSDDKQTIAQQQQQIEALMLNQLYGREEREESDSDALRHIISEQERQIATLHAKQVSCRHQQSDCSEFMFTIACFFLAGRQ